ncbi:hypothetical protein AKJ16_DCAP15020 [Drosera capensis]
MLSLDTGMTRGMEHKIEKRPSAPAMIMMQYMFRTGYSAEVLSNAYACRLHNCTSSESPRMISITTFICRGGFFGSIVTSICVSSSFTTLISFLFFVEVALLPCFILSSNSNFDWQLFPEDEVVVQMFDHEQRCNGDILLNVGMVSVLENIWKTSLQYLVYMKASQ